LDAQSARLHRRDDRDGLGEVVAVIVLDRPQAI
jgi:hypothetical protein